MNKYTNSPPHSETRGEISNQPGHRQDITHDSKVLNRNDDDDNYVIS
jgi:hypothetical protein